MIKQYQGQDEWEKVVKEFLTSNPYPKFKKQKEPMLKVKMKTKMVFKLVKEQGHKLNYRITSQEIDVYNENYVLSINFHLYGKILKQMGKSDVITRHKIEQRLCSQFEMKKLSTWALRQGDKDKDFYLMVGLENLWGYNVKPDLTGHDILDSIKKWVSIPFIPKVEGYNTLFRQKVKELLNKGKVVNFDTTIASYCENVPVTSTSGSGYDPETQKVKPDVEYGGEKVKIENNKFGKSFALSKEQKMKKVLSEEPSLNKVSIKVENYPKVRYIIGSDYKTFLKMNYVELWLKQVLSGIGYSTLWMSQPDLHKMWEDTCLLHGVRVPVDQSAFDHHVSKEMVIIMLEEIKALVIDKCIGNKLELEMVMNALIKSVLTSKVIVPKTLTGFDDDVILEYLNGVLSGWRWTALLDTIANVAEMLVAVDYLKSEGIVGYMKLFNAQGDDQNVIVTSWSYALGYWASLSMNGFEIHVTKNFFSDHHTEYLRRYSVKDKGINGYPARMINKMNFIYPGKQENLEMVEKASSTVSKWKTLFQRLFRTDLMVPYIKSDLVGAKMAKAFIDVFLSTSKLRGGAQITGKDETTRITWIPGEYRRKFTVNNSPGLKQFESNYGDGQVEEIENWSVKVLKVQIKQEQEPALSVEPATRIESLPFIIGKNITVNKPLYAKNWGPEDIFALNDTVFTHAFTNWNIYERKHDDVPKKWLKEFVTGNLKVTMPARMDRMSDEFTSMFCKSSEGSVYTAMFGKRRHVDKWLGIQKFFMEEMERRIGAYSLYMF